MLNNPGQEGRAEKAFDFALKMAQDLEYEECIEWLTLSQDLTKSKGPLTKKTGLISGKKTLGGYLKNAFVLSFYHLLLFSAGFEAQPSEEEFFKVALHQSIEVGGDTDTNACIAGAMIGALVGQSKIP